MSEPQPGYPGACGPPIVECALLGILIAIGPCIMLVGSCASDRIAKNILHISTHPLFVNGSFISCQLVLSAITRSQGIGQLGIWRDVLNEYDRNVAMAGVVAFATVILMNMVLIFLWPNVLSQSPAVTIGTNVNCIACAAHYIKLVQPGLLVADFSGHAQLIGRSIAWHHNISLMTMLLNLLTPDSAQEQCFRVLLAYLSIEFGTWGVIDLGSPRAAWVSLFLSQACLTWLCVCVYRALRGSTSQQRQKRMLGMFVFVTWHAFSLIYGVIALDFVPASSELTLYTIADVVTKLLITTAMLQGHIKVASDTLVVDLKDVRSDRQMMRDDLKQLILAASVPIIVTNAQGQVTVWNRTVAETSCLPPETAHGVCVWELPSLTPESAENARVAICALLQQKPRGEPAGEAQLAPAPSVAAAASASGLPEPSPPLGPSAGGLPVPLSTMSFELAFTRAALPSPPPSSPPSSCHGRLGVGGAEAQHTQRSATTLLLVSASITHNAAGVTTGLICLCANMTAEYERVLGETQRRTIEALSDAKDQFLACMSHEMRTPLSALIGLLHLVANKGAAEWTYPSLAPLVTSAVRSAEHLYVLVSDVLDMSKVQHGQLTLHVADFDLKETIEAVAGRCRHVLTLHDPPKTLELRIVLQPDALRLRTLRGDDQRLQQIITNLGTNAIKYTMRGSVTIGVSVRELDQGEAAAAGLDTAAAEWAPRPCVAVELEVRVDDTGLGIPQSALNRIFDLFETAAGDAAMTNPKVGISSASGIGLTICKELVNAMGGSLTVSSTVNLGSSFTFKLATLAFPEGALPLQGQLSHGSFGALPGAGPPFTSADALPPSRPARLLLVEDDEMNRVVIALFLEGHALLEAHNGLEGVVLAYHSLSGVGERLDVCVLDINMPLLSGRQAVQLIRLMQFGVSPWAEHLPIISLTANAMESEFRRCLGAGMTECLIKPVSQQAFVTVVSRLVAKNDHLAAQQQQERLEAQQQQQQQPAAVDSEPTPRARAIDSPHVQAMLPLVRELCALLVTVVQHDVGVRESIEGRSEALVGCLAWTLELLDMQEGARELRSLLPPMPVLPSAPRDEAASASASAELLLRAKAHLQVRAQEWLQTMLGASGSQSTGV